MERPKVVIVDVEGVEDKSSERGAQMGNTRKSRYLRFVRSANMSDGSSVSWLLHIVIETATQNSDAKPIRWKDGGGKRMGEIQRCERGEAGE